MGIKYLWHDINITTTNHIKGNYLVVTNWGYIDDNYPKTKGLSVCHAFIPLIYTRYKNRYKSKQFTATDRHKQDLETIVNKLTELGVNVEAAKIGVGREQHFGECLIAIICGKFNNIPYIINIVISIPIEGIYNSTLFGRNTNIIFEENIDYKPIGDNFTDWYSEYTNTVYPNAEKIDVETIKDVFNYFEKQNKLPEHMSIHEAFDYLAKIKL